MFEDFHPTANSAEARKRRSQSLAAACVLYSSLFGGLVAATATAREAIVDDETQVTFAPPPEPEPEPEPPPPPEVKPEVKALKPKANRARLDPPDKLKDQKLEESNKDLAEADSAGPVDGFLDGVEGGQGSGTPPPPPPPPPKATPVKPPVAVSLAKPRYSAKARRKGIEGSVVVQFEVTTTGTVRNLRVVSGAPDLAEMVMREAVNWRFKPAIKDGKPIAYRMSKTVTFRLDEA